MGRIGKLMIVYLSLGTNLGNREANLATACDMIECNVGHIVRRSDIIETDPQGFVSTNRFLNMCLAVQTNLAAQDILNRTQRIERQMGRTQKSLNGIYHDRVIDIDILICGDLRINTDRLTIPHPRMFERDFVLIPLQQIIDNDIAEII